MGNFLLYLKDYAPTGTRTFEAGKWTNGPLATDKIGVAQVDHADANISWTMPAARTIGDIGLYNHNCSGATLYLQKYDGSWVNVGDPQSITSNANKIFTFDAAGQSDTMFRMKITGASGCAIGGIALLGRQTGQVIEFVDATISLPIGMTLQAPITTVRAVAGEPLQQMHGYPWQTWQVTFDHAQLNDTTAGQEGMLDDYFLDPQYGVQGFLGPCWLRDDFGRDYPGVVVPPISWPVTSAHGRTTGVLTFETVPHVEVG
jgi:hypothetical protein